MRNYFMLVFLVYLTACTAAEKGFDREVWLVIAVSSHNLPVKTGMTMTLTNDYIIFSDKDQTVGYSILKSEDRLVMETDTAKLLFKIEKTSDSTMSFKELYTLVPLNISFAKTANHIKHKR